jgi:hypothetical protein
LAIQAFDRRFHVAIIRHLDKAKATRSASVAVHHHFRGGHFAKLPKKILQIRRGIRPGQIAHIDPLSHPTSPYNETLKYQQIPCGKKQRPIASSNYLIALQKALFTAEL